MQDPVVKIVYHPETPANLRNFGERGTEMSVGYDLRIAAFLGGSVPVNLPDPGTERLGIYPGETLRVEFHVAVDTRAMFMPIDATDVRVGMAMTPIIVPRSGLGTKGLTLANGTGVIDPDWTKPLSGVLQLASWAEPLVIRRWDRVAQMLFMSCMLPPFQVVDAMEGTSRDGFGSTGVA